MKPIGILLFVIGCVAVIVSLNERGAAYGTDVYNNGLLNERTNDVIASCAAVLAGAILCVGGYIIDALGRQRELMQVMVRLSKKTLLHSGIDLAEVNDVIDNGNAKK